MRALARRRPAPPAPASAPSGPRSGAAPRPGQWRGLAVVVLVASAGCGGTRAGSLPFTEVRALCEQLLPQVTGDFACRMDELQASTRTGAEPRYDVEAVAEFRTNGRLDHFSDLRASGPSSDPTQAPADCAAHAFRRLQVAERADTLTMHLRLQYRESDALMAAASVQPDGQCTLTIPVRGP